MGILQVPLPLLPFRPKLCELGGKPSGPNGVQNCLFTLTDVESISLKWHLLAEPQPAAPRKAIVLGVDDSVR